MSIKFTIFNNRGLVFVRYRGTALIDASARAFGAYVSHPEFQPAQKQLIDLQYVTGYERDFPRIFELQMRKAEVLINAMAQSFIVYYAPTPTALGLAHIICRSWDAVPNVAARVVDTTEADALELIGQTDGSFENLLQSSDGFLQVSEP
ncbi:MAG: hypothetical protein ABJL99_07230 [Aliishimia sp.]